MLILTTINIIPLADSISDLLNILPRHAISLHNLPLIIRYLRKELMRQEPAFDLVTMRHDLSDEGPIDCL